MNIWVLLIHYPTIPLHTIFLAQLCGVWFYIQEEL